MAGLKMWCLKLVCVMLFCKLQLVQSKEVDDVVLKKIELFESTLINQQNQINDLRQENSELKPCKTYFQRRQSSLQKGRFGRPKPSC